MACLVLEHLEDLDGALDEVARVLRPGGRFVVFVNHPLFQTPGSGWVDDQVLDPPEQYWRVGPYLPETVTVEEVDAGRAPAVRPPPAEPLRQRPGRRGLYLDPHDRARAAAPASWPWRPQYEDAATIPRLLVLRAERR